MKAYASSTLRIANRFDLRSLARTSDAGELFGIPRGRTVLHLHPAAITGAIRLAFALGDDALETQLAHRLEQRRAVVEH